MLPGEIWLNNIFPLITSEPLGQKKRYKDELRFVQIFRECCHLRLINRDLYSVFKGAYNTIKSYKIHWDTDCFDPWQISALKVYFFKISLSNCKEDVLSKIFDLLPMHNDNFDPNLTPQNSAWIKILIYIYQQYPPKVLSHPHLLICNVLQILADEKPEVNTSPYETLLDLFLHLDSAPKETLYRKVKMKGYNYVLDELSGESSIGNVIYTASPLCFLTIERITPAMLAILIKYGLDLSLKQKDKSLLSRLYKQYKHKESDHKILEKMQILLDNGARPSNGLIKKIPKLKRNESTAPLIDVLSPYLISVKNTY